MVAATGSARSRLARTTLGVAALYLALAVWALRVLLPAPASTYPLPSATERTGLGDADQSLMIWATSRNARTLLSAPSRLHDWEECFPTPQASGLGTPYLGDGILAIPAYLLGANPILTLNVVSLLMLWLSALAMFALAYYWTGHVGAAFVAGLAFGFHPNRVLGAHWPHIMGNQWTPLAFLFTHRLFSRRRWRDAAGLSLALGMQILASFYQVLPLVVMGAPYAVGLAVRHRRRLLGLAPKVVAVTVVALLVAYLQFSSHLYMQRVWGTLTGHFIFPMTADTFLPGHDSSPGVIVLLLGGVALLDRCRRRRRRHGSDPRLAFLALVPLAVWTVVIWIDLPGLPFHIYGFAAVFKSIVPGLDAVRGIMFGRLGAYMPCALLAAFGVVALTAGRRRGTRIAVSAVAAGALLAEVFVPALSLRSYGLDTSLAAHDILPPAETLAMYDGFGPGPILDLPVAGDVAPFGNLGHALILAAFHRRPIGACYQPYPSRLSEEVKTFARRLPEVRAAEDLAALGFETVVVHGDLLGPFAPMVIRQLRTLETVAALSPVAGTADHWAFRLRAPARLRADLAALLPPPAGISDQAVTAPAGDVHFLFRNVGPATYRHPDPIEPTPIVVRWSDRVGARVAEQHLPVLLPLALTPGEEITRTVRLDVPTAPGMYHVTLARDDAPGQVLAQGGVQVTPP